MEVRMRNQRNQARHHVGLILAFVGLISGATLALKPARLASAQAVPPSWSFTGNLSAGRLYGHTATLLPNGKILIVGGIFSNGLSQGELSSAELYDPATGMWTITGNLNTARADHIAMLLPNGKVLVAGGAINCGNYCSIHSAELYDPATGSWSL